MTPNPPPRSTVGVVGLGRMGSAIAKQLGASHRVLGWDIRNLQNSPIALVSDPSALPQQCDVILLVLPSPVETHKVVLDPAFHAQLMESSCVLVDMSTSDPASIRELAKKLGSAGERLLDAPVLGRPDTCGSWTVPVGGDASAFERAEPALSVLAKRVLHVGGHGAAHTIKLLNNMMFAAINVITAEVIGACERLDVPPERFVDIISESAAATVSPLFRDLAPRMLGEARETVFTVQLLQKDLQLAVGMCEQAGVPLISARALQIAVSQAIEHGLGELDTAALVNVYKKKSGGSDGTG